MLQNSALARLFSLVRIYALLLERYDEKLIKFHHQVPERGRVLSWQILIAQLRSLQIFLVITDDQFFNSQNLCNKPLSLIKSTFLIISLFSILIWEKKEAKGRFPLNLQFYRYQKLKSKTFLWQEKNTTDLFLEWISYFGNEDLGTEVWLAVPFYFL